jgi:hypothetical protein
MVFTLRPGMVFGFPPECCSAWPESPASSSCTVGLRQERISSLLQIVFRATYLRQAEKESVSTDSKELKLVDGMGFEDKDPS